MVEICPRCTKPMEQEYWGPCGPCRVAMQKARTGATYRQRRDARKYINSLAKNKGKVAA